MRIWNSLHLLQQVFPFLTLLKYYFTKIIQYLFSTCNLNFLKKIKRLVNINSNNWKSNVNTKNNRGKMLNITAIQWCLAHTYILKKPEKNFSFGYFFISWLVNLLPFSCQDGKKHKKKPQNFNQTKRTLQPLHNWQQLWMTACRAKDIYSITSVL